MQVPSRITAEREVNDEIVARLTQEYPMDVSDLRVENENNISQLKFDLSDATTIISVIEIGIFTAGLGKAIFDVLKKRKDTSVSIRLANGESVTIHASQNVELGPIVQVLTNLLGDRTS